MIAFETVYGSVATDCHLPQGKNRHHKFKDKVVEVWHAMEGEMGEKKHHPLYQLGMKQLNTYRTVAKTLEGGGSNPSTPSKPAAKRAPSSAKGSTSAEKPSVVGGTSSGSRRKSRLTTATSSRSVAPDSGQLTELMKICDQGFMRLESISSQQLPPKLPSPLQELHRMKMQLQQRDDVELLNLIEPYYGDAVGAHLNQVSHQAKNSAHPAMLPTVLEGLDTLLNAKQDASLEASIRYTYKVVFQSYLSLVNPNVSSGEGGAAGSSQTRAAKRKSKGGDDEGVSNKKHAADDDGVDDAMAV